MPGAKERLDQLLVARGFLASREAARRIILAGRVFVDGRRLDKPGARVAAAAEIEVRGDSNPYVSRGGLKLARALDALGVPVAGAVAVDVGASTGGFTDCLLSRGASRVYAVDVGFGQLDWKLRQDPRVTVMERTNARHLQPDSLPEPVDLAVIDVSFISLTKILPPVSGLVAPGGWIVCLVKPQFEAGRERVGKRGVVRDPAVQRDVLARMASFCQAIGLAVAGLTFSPIKGPRGNIEFFIGARLPAGAHAAAPLGEEDVAQMAEGVVAAAHAALGGSGAGMRAGETN